jgi:hypothetical protein
VSVARLSSIPAGSNSRILVLSGLECVQTAPEYRGPGQYQVSLRSAIVIAVEMVPVRTACPVRNFVRSWVDGKRGLRTALHR